MTTESEKIERFKKEFTRRICSTAMLISICQKILKNEDNIKKDFHSPEVLAEFAIGLLQASWEALKETDPTSCKYSELATEQVYEQGYVNSEPPILRVK